MHEPSGESVSYDELVDVATALPVLKNVRLKPKDAHTLIGQPPGDAIGNRFYEHSWASISVIGAMTRSCDNALHCGPLNLRKGGAIHAT